MRKVFAFAKKIYGLTNSVEINFVANTFYLMDLLRFYSVYVLCRNEGCVAGINSGMNIFFFKGLNC